MQQHSTTPRLCSFLECDRPHYAHSFCRVHYRRNREGKDMYAPIEGHILGLSDEERFWRKVNRTEPDGCWLWTASHDGRGYGHFSVRNKSGRYRQEKAYRFAYMLEYGEIPKHLELDHLCRNPPCVNPSHLEAVTHLENVRRGESGAWQRRKTHCPQGHEYTPKNTYPGLTGRRCITCARQRSYQQRIQAKASSKAANI